MTIFNDKELKLWRMALDKSVTQGEMENAMSLILNSLRSRNFSYEELTGKPQQQRHYSKQTKQTSWGTSKMPFGKYKGEMIQDIDLNYLYWAVSWIQEDEGRSKSFAWLVTIIENYLQE